MASRRRPQKRRPDLRDMVCRLSEIASLFSVATRSLDALDLQDARADEVNVLRAGLAALDEFRADLDRVALQLGHE